MESTAPTGPSTTPVTTESDTIVRALFPNAADSDALVNLTREIVVAAERYIVAIQNPDTAMPVPPAVASPSVRANEHLLNGALHALTVDGLSTDERAQLTILARTAARKAGMDHLTIASAA